MANEVVSGFYNALILVGQTTICDSHSENEYCRHARTAVARYAPQRFLDNCATARLTAKLQITEKTF
jgi:hypothetical protein